MIGPIFTLHDPGRELAGGQFHEHGSDYVAGKKKSIVCAMVRQFMDTKMSAL